MRVFFLCLWFAVGHAMASPQLHDLAVLEDKTGTLTIETIAAAEPAQFKPLPQGSFAGGFNRNTHWFRFTVAHAGESWLDILPPVLDDLRLYEVGVKAPGGWRERRAGDTLPFAAREVPYRGFVFKLQHADETPRTYYLRLQTTSTTAFIPRIWAAEDFVAASNLESGLLIASIAIILMVILLNLNDWFWLRDPLAPWFLAYLLSLDAHFMGISGLAQQYLFPDLPVVSYYLVCSSALLTMATGYGFYRRFFGIARTEPLLYLLYEVCTVLPLLALPFALLGYYPEIGPYFNSLTILMALVGVAVSVRIWLRGAPGAGMMFLANLISMVGILFALLNVLGVTTGGPFAWHSLQITALGSIVALQIALGARYRAMRDERIQAERDARNERDMRLQQGRFLAMLAHELRTSLSVLKMAVLRQPMSPQAVASAERAILGMSDVIERSIQAEKLVDGSLQPDCQPCDVTGLLEAVIADSPCPERFRLEAGTPDLRTDGKLLRVIFANLVDNAAKYAAPDTPIIVTLASTPADGILLSIANAAGPAGAPDAGKVFDKYYRAPEAHGLTGSGLGLYIAQGIAQHLGGNLSYRPAQGQVRFELRMPTHT